MRKLFTVKLIGGLRPAPQPYEISDSKVPGLIARVQPSGRVAYYTILGRGRRCNLGQHPVVTLEQARKSAMKALTAAQAGATNLEVKAVARPRSVKVITLGSFIDDKYADWLHENLRTGKAEAARLRSACKDLLDKPLAELTAWSIERWRADRLKPGRAPSAVNRDYNALRAALRRANVWGSLKAPPPKVKRLKVDNAAVVRFLNPDEELSLRAALDARELRMREGRESGNAWRAERGYELLPTRTDAFVDLIKPFILTLLNTGMRRGEAFNLVWRDIDFERRVLVVRGSGAKSGQSRVIPLSAEAFEALKSWRKQNGGEGIVFAGREGERLTTLKKAWAGLMTAAGIKDFRMHDCRHTFASKLVQQGVSLSVVRDLLGHATTEMTERYSHLADTDLRDAMAKMQPAQAPSREKRA